MSTATIDRTPPPADVDTQEDLPVVTHGRGGLGALIAASALGALVASGLTWLVVATVGLDFPMNALGF
jgi:hypothetical protein